MPDAGTASTATTTTTLTTTMNPPINTTLPVPPSPPSSPEPSTSSNSSTMSRWQPFTPTQCLFCPHSSPSFSDNVEHMRKTHGLFVPRPDNLRVDLEALFEHLHLVIFGYRECIKCGRESATVQGAQQHMTGKQGHCSFDISEPDSEFAQFYDDDDDDDDSDLVSPPEGGAARTGHGPVLSIPSLQAADEDSIRLSSGRIISKKPPTVPKPSFKSFGARSRRQFRRSDGAPAPARIEGGGGSSEPEDDEDNCRGDGPEHVSAESSETPRGRQVTLSKRETRERAMAEYQLTRMSASDRSSLMHLPASQQRSLLAAQHRQEEKVQTDERRRRAKIDRKGNKNLYAYWHTETPVYQCG